MNVRSNLSSKVLAVSIFVSLLSACATPTTSTPTDPTPASKGESTPSASAPAVIETKSVEAAFKLTRGEGSGIKRFVIIGAVRPLIAALASNKGKIHLFDANSGRYEADLNEDVPLKDTTELLASGYTLMAISPKQQQAMLWRYEYEASPIGILKFKGPSAPLAVESAFNETGVLRLYSIDDVSGTREMANINIKVVPPRLNRHLVLDDFSYESINRKPLEIGQAGTASSISMDAATAETQLIISSGNNLAAFDLEGNKLNRTFPSVDQDIFGVQRRHCHNNFGDVLLIGSKKNGSARIDIFDPKTNEKLGVFSVPELKDPTQMMFFQQRMEFFPDGALYFASEGNYIVGVDWATVAKATGVRARCF